MTQKHREVFYSKFLLAIKIFTGSPRVLPESDLLKQDRLGHGGARKCVCECHAHAEHMDTVADGASVQAQHAPAGVGVGCCHPRACTRTRGQACTVAGTGLHMHTRTFLQAERVLLPCGPHMSVRMMQASARAAHTHTRVSVPGHMGHTCPMDAALPGLSGSCWPHAPLK